MKPNQPSPHAFPRIRGVQVSLLLVVVVCGVLFFSMGVSAVDECNVTVQDGDSLQTAIDGASLDDTICVEPGSYDESIVIDVDGLTLVAAEESTPVIQGFGSGTGVTVDGVQNVTIDGFEIREFDTAISVEDSPNATVTNSTIIENDWALRDDDTNSHRLVISHNQIENNGIRGLFIESSDDVQVTENHFEGNGHESSTGRGLQFRGGTAALIERNTIVNNNGMGISVWTADPVIRENTVSNHSTGIHLRSGTSGSADNGIVENNTVENNELGMEFSGISAPNILDNTVAGSDLAILLTSTSQATVSDNELETGIALEGDSDTFAHFDHVMSGNTLGGDPIIFEKGEDAPSIPADAGQIIIVDSTNVEVSGFEFDGIASGIQIAYSPGAQVTQNDVTNTSSHGIHLWSSDDANVSDNVAINNSETSLVSGIGIIGSSNVIVSENYLADHDRVALLVEESPEASIEGNVLIDNWDGIRLFNSNRAEVTNNTITGTHHGDGFVSSFRSAILVSRSEQVEFIGNHIFDNVGNGIHDNGGLDSTGARMENNTISGNGNEGFYWRSSGGATFTNNTVEGNTARGIFGPTDATVVNNTVSDNGATGIDVSHNSHVAHNLVTENGNRGISANQDSTVNNNTISNNGGSGLYFERYGSQIVENNTLSGHDIDLLIDGTTNVTLRNNTFEAGVLLDSFNRDREELGTHTFENNTVGGDDLFYASGVDDPEVPESVGQAILVNASNVTIAGQEFDGAVAPIQVYFGDDIEISNNVIVNDPLEGFSARGTIGVWESNRTTVRDNQVFAGGVSELGIQIAQGVDISLINNTVTDVISHGLIIEESGENYSIRENSISGASEDGIHVAGIADVVIESNFVSENDRDGIHLRAEAANATLGDNTAIFNGAHGIRVFDSQFVTIDGNDMSQNDGPGLRVEGESANATIIDNIANANAGPGIHVRPDPDSSWKDTPDNVSVESNEARNNDEDPNAYTASFYGITIEGIEAANVDSNFVAGNDRGGILIADSVGIRVRHNSVSDNGDVHPDFPSARLGTGIHVIESTDIFVDGNTVTDNPVEGIEVESGSTDVEVSYNNVEENTRRGIIITDANAVEVHHNIIRNNDVGVLLDGVSASSTAESVTLRTNLVTSNTKQGIIITGVDEAYAVDNDILGNDVGVFVDGDAFNATLRDNEIDGNVFGVDGSVSNHLVDARENWWGDDSGPSGGVADPETGEVADGSGDEVSENVRFDSWLSQAATGTLDGQVTDNETDTPLQDAAVSLVDAEGGLVDTAITDSAGNYSIDAEPGTYDLVVEAIGYQQATVEEVELIEDATTTENVALDPAPVIDASVSYQEGTEPDMDNISVDAFMAGGMLQLQLVNETAPPDDLAAREELAGVGADATTTFQINITEIELEPRMLIGAGQVESWSVVNNTDGTYNLTIEVTPIDQDLIIDCAEYPDGCVPPMDAWPGEENDVATTDRTATVGLAADSLDDVPEEWLHFLDQMVITTDAQVFGTPVYDPEAEELSLFVAGPHETVAGEPNDGFYRAFIPDALLTEWGVENPEDELTAAFEGEPKDFTVDPAANGTWIDVDISYSAGNVTLSTADPENLRVDITGTNAPITEGDDLTADVLIENTGESTGEQQIELHDLDGNIVDTATVSLAGAASESITLTWSTADGDAGTGEVTVVSENDSATANIEIDAEEPDPAFFEVTISNHTTPVTEGEILQVEITIENTGEESGSQPVELLNFAGDPVDGRTLTLSPGETEAFTLTWTTVDGDAGTDDIAVRTEDDLVAVEATVEEAAAAGEFVIDSVDADSPVTEGDDVVVTAVVSNPGDEVVTRTVELLNFYGDIVGSTSVTIEAGETTTLTLGWETSDGDADSGDVSVRTVDEIASVDVTVEEPDSSASFASFMIDDIDVGSPVTEGEDVVVTAAIQNTGNEFGGQMIELVRDGEVVDERSLEIGPGASEMVSLSWPTMEGDAGSWEFAVRTADDLETIDVTVETSPEPAEISIADVDANSPVVAGEELLVTIELENVGETTGGTIVELRDWDGVSVDTIETGGIAPGVTESVTVAWQTEEGVDGTEMVTIVTPDDSAAVEVTIEEPSAEFTVEDVVLNPTAVAVGDTIEVTATIRNVGNVAGVVDASLAIDGAVTDAAELELGPGESEQVAYTYTFEETGEYSVHVAGEVLGTVEVGTADDGDGGADDQPGEDDGLPGFGPIAALLGLLIGSQLLRRR